MGKILQAVGSIFGLGGSPHVSPAAGQTLDQEQSDSQVGRAALYDTAGGSEGETLDQAQVRQRNTLFGN